MRTRTPTPDGEAIEENRDIIRELLAEGETAICEAPAVTSKQAAAHTAYTQSTVQNRMKVDPAITKISAIDPETYTSTYAYLLAEDKR